jgi:hypothetical protein
MEPKIDFCLPIANTDELGEFFFASSSSYCLMSRMGIVIFDDFIIEKD